MVLTAKILAVLMIGSTHYIDIGKDTDAVIYYPSETVAHMTLPDGPTFKGDLKINESGYFVDWQEGPPETGRLSMSLAPSPILARTAKPLVQSPRLSPAMQPNSDI